MFLGITLLSQCFSPPWRLLIFLLGKNKYYQCFKKLNVELLSLMRVEQAPVLREPWKRLALQL